MPVGAKKARKRFVFHRGRKFRLRLACCVGRGGRFIKISGESFKGKTRHKRQSIKQRTFSLWRKKTSTVEIDRTRGPG
jgi:hypothetical protein